MQYGAETLVPTDSRLLVKCITSHHANVTVTLTCPGLSHATSTSVVAGHVTQRQPVTCVCHVQRHVCRSVTSTSTNVTLTPACKLLWAEFRPNLRQIRNKWDKYVTFSEISPQDLSPEVLCTILIDGRDSHLYF